MKFHAFWLHGLLVLGLFFYAQHRGWSPFGGMGGGTGSRHSGSGSYVFHK